MGLVRKSAGLASFGFLFAAVSAAAQAVTASGGTANSVPKFSSGTTLVNSVITETNGKIGIKTNNPSAPLDIAGYLHITGDANPSTPDQGSYLDWNALTGGIGETDLINNQGGGYGGFAFMNTPPSGTPRSTLMFINGSGNVGIGTTSPEQRLSLAGGSVSLDGYGYVSSYRGPLNSFSNLFLGGAIAANSTGSYTVKTDGGSNYFAAIRMDNSGGNAGAINFYTGATVGGVDYSLTEAQLGSYERMTIVGGNVGIGTTTPGARVEVNGNLKLTSGSGSSITFADNTTQSTAWTGTACGGDYAESVDVSGDRTRYEPGDVLVIDVNAPGKFLKSNEPYSSAITGIYSTKPGFIGRRQTTDPKTSTSEIPMAMIGIVPTKVSAENGSIKPGDFLVTSSTPGYAMKGTDRQRMFGAVVGKALGSLDSGRGLIEAAVSLQ